MATRVASTDDGSGGGGSSSSSVSSTVDDILRQVSDAQRKQIDDLFSLCAESTTIALRDDHEAALPAERFITLMGLRKIAGNLSDKELQQLFDRLDQDNDGRIMYHDWVVGCAKWILGLSFPDASAVRSSSNDSGLHGIDNTGSSSVVHTDESILQAEIESLDMVRLEPRRSSEHIDVTEFVSLSLSRSRTVPCYRRRSTCSRNNWRKPTSSTVDSTKRSRCSSEPFKARRTPISTPSIRCRCCNPRYHSVVHSLRVQLPTGVGGANTNASR